MKQKAIILFFVLLFSVAGMAQKRLVILHTNDTHSQIEPLPDNDRYNPGQGGVINRKAVIDSIRRVEKNILLIDAGDFLQGTPYYNLFKGRVEAETLNALGYEVGTIGNHEFDYGLDTLKMVIEMLDFPIISSNYDFSNTVMKGMVEPYVILKKKVLKVWSVCEGIQPEGLIQKDKYEGMKFLPVEETVNRYADLLRNKEKCDVVICLSHIGYNHDQALAAASRNLDLIIGGHSHTLMHEGPDKIKDLDGEEVMVYQAGGRGVVIGMVELELQKKKR